MDRALRVASVWNWLPVFRAVAELQGLRKASETLGISASAVSRTIRLIEDHLGCELFERTGKNMVPNDRGKELLEAVRSAMRAVDDGITAVTSGAFVGKLTISAAGPLIRPLVEPAIRELLQEHTSVSPVLLSLPESEINDALLQGAIDMAICSSTSFSDALEVEKLVTMEHTIFCSDSHPILQAGAKHHSEYAFVAPLLNENGHEQDGWPPGSPRNVRYRVSQMFVGADLCATGTALAFLPTLVGQQQGLNAVNSDVTATSSVYLVTRPQLTDSTTPITALRRIFQAHAQRAQPQALPSS